MSRRKTYLTPERQWDQTVAYYLAEGWTRRTVVVDDRGYPQAQIGVVVQPHRFFKLHDLVVANIIDGQAHSAQVWAISSKGRRVKGFRLIWQRYWDAFPHHYYSIGFQDRDWWGRTKRGRKRPIEKPDFDAPDFRRRDRHKRCRNKVPLALYFEYPDELRGLRVTDPAVRRLALALRARHADRRVGTSIPAHVEFPDGPPD